MSSPRLPALIVLVLSVGIVRAQRALPKDTMPTALPAVPGAGLTAPPAPLGLFCRLDVELDKRLPMPVRFRLGDAIQVDRWEGHGPGDPRLLR